MLSRANNNGIRIAATDQAPIRSCAIAVTVPRPVSSAYDTAKPLIGFGNSAGKASRIGIPTSKWMASVIKPVFTNMWRSAEIPIRIAL
jgi:hypothetical protein